MLLQMKIDHRGFYLAMSKQCFDDMDIITLIEHVGGEAMPQSVCCKRLFFKSRFGHRTVYYYLHASYMNGSLGLFAGKKIFFRPPFFKI